MIPYILVVEDEDALATLLHYNLEKEGYRVDRRRRRRGGADPIDEQLPDLVVLDWMLPKVSRHRGLPAPARAARDPQPADHHADRPRRGDRPHPRPGHRRRRLCGQAVLDERTGRPHPRRAAPHPPGPGRGPHAATATSSSTAPPTGCAAAASEMHLGPTEFRLLDYLMQHPGRVFSREQLLDAVWGSDVYVEARTVDVHIGRLRKALNQRRSTTTRSAPSAPPAIRWTSERAEGALGRHTSRAAGKN